MEDRTMDVVQCPVCYGESVTYLGQLGGLMHYQCNHCGMQWSKEYSDKELEDLQCTDSTH